MDPAQALPGHVRSSESLIPGGLCLLSLDGGGVRGLSTLYILKDIMECLNYHCQEIGLPPKKPCDVFDLIGGTSSGGLIAIMLGRLEMDVDECISAYLEIMKAVFEGKSSIFPVGKTKAKVARSSKLSTTFGEIIRRAGALPDARFNNGQSSRCKTFICTEISMKGPARLRSYSLPEDEEQHDTSPTISEAALASSALWGFFDNVSIGSHQFTDGAGFANNPVEEVEDEAMTIWGVQRGTLSSLVACFISIGTGYTTKFEVADSTFKFLTEALVSIQKESEDTEARFVSLRMEAFRKKQYFRFSVQQSLQEVSLDDLKERDLITTATHVYLQLPMQRFQLRDCVQSLRNKTESVGLNKFSARLSFEEQVREVNIQGITRENLNSSKTKAAIGCSTDASSIRVVSFDNDPDSTEPGNSIQTVNTGGGAVFHGDITAARDITINHFTEIRQVADKFCSHQELSTEFSDRLISSLAVLRETAEFVETYAEDLQKALPANNRQLQVISKESTSILSDLRRLVASLENRASTEDINTIIYPTGSLQEQVMEIRTRLLAVQMHLGQVRARESLSGNHSQALQEAVSEILNNPEITDDSSSIQTFHTSHSVPYVDRQMWRELERALRSRFSMQAIRDNYALIIKTAESVITNKSTQDSMSLLQDEQLSPLMEESNENMQSSIKAASPGAEVAKLPCMILPPVSGTKFFGREAELKTIEDFFDRTNKQSFQSLVVYGMGGIGKSTVALMYARTRLRERALDALFWVQCDTAASIRISFSHIATALQLPHATPENHERNRTLVLDWLQHTRCIWLMVYDNASNMDLIQPYWATGFEGQALITTRDPSFAFELADRRIELFPWDASTGAQFLQHLLATPAENSEGNTQSGMELSSILGGHPLAILYFAGLIHRRSMSTEDFLAAHKKTPNAITHLCTNGPTDKLWTSSFESLSPQDGMLLGVCCYLAPDGISESLFEVDIFKFPERLQVYSDYLSLAESIERLLSLSLLQRNKKSSSYSLHPVVRIAFKHFMTAEQRQQSFDDTVLLLSSSFPSIIAIELEPHIAWPMCAPKAGHVLALKDYFQEDKMLHSRFAASETYFSLIDRCYQYLFDSCALTDLDSLTEIHRATANAFPKERETRELEALTPCHTELSSIRQVNLIEQRHLLHGIYEEIYQSQIGELPHKCLETALAAEHLALTYVSLKQFDDALKWQENAYEFWSSQEIVNSSSGQWVPLRMRNIATILFWSGDINRARELTTTALNQLSRNQPENWHALAFTHFTLGTIERAEHHLENAKGHFRKALVIWRDRIGYPTHQFPAACHYKLGCIALELDKLDAAISHLQDAAPSTSSMEVVTMEHHARCWFKLSEALERYAEFTKSNNHLLPAKSYRYMALSFLQNAGLNAQEPMTEQTFDSFVKPLWR